MASCGCQFGWQGSPDCEYTYSRSVLRPGRRAYYAWLPALTAGQDVTRHHRLDKMQKMGEGKPTLGRSNLGQYMDGSERRSLIEHGIESGHQRLLV